jgi:choline dehydrogenase-like flavoprotein
MLYVIGSGPAGVSAAYALLQQGKQVTMLDAGLTLEPEIEKDLIKLGKQHHKRWNERLLQRFKSTGQAKGSVRKLSYGSDYMYRGEHVPMVSTDVDCSPSFARGGLSTVWGAAVLPYLQQDIKAWPITIRQLAPHYQAVLEFMPITGAHDGLAAFFPFKVEWQEHKHSRQALELLKALDSKHLPGITFGSARLAVNVKGDGHGCAYCGMCMYGCPYQLIYSTSMTLAQMMKNPNFRYIKGIVVERLQEDDDLVTIHAKMNGKPAEFYAERVFLGAGVIPTTSIMMRSMQLRKTTVKDSQYFIVPALMKRTKDVSKEELHALAQLFIEIQDKSISKRTIHLQVYTYNDLYEQEFKRRFGKLYRFIPKKILLERMIVIQGFLHSDDSSSIKVEATEKGLRLEKEENPRSKAMISKALRKISSSRICTPITPLLSIEKPGRSFHFGGSLPMARRPRPGQTDIYGRPHGSKRIHIVDASTFPSIPATTITYTIMANAHRIASQYEAA